MSRHWSLRNIPWIKSSLNKAKHNKLLIATKEKLKITATVNLAKCETTARTHDAFCTITQTQCVNCPFNCPITLSAYKRDMYTVLLVLKSGWWWPIMFKNFVFILINNRKKLTIDKGEKVTGDPVKLPLST